MTCCRAGAGKRRDMWMRVSSRTELTGDESRETHREIVAMRRDLIGRERSCHDEQRLIRWKDR